MIAGKILYLHFVFKRSLSICHTATFLADAHRFEVALPKLQIFWVLDTDYSQDEKAILGIFVYFFIYEVTTIKVNFRF